MTIRKRIVSHIKNISKTKKIIVLVLIIFLLLLVYDYKYYTLNIENVDEIVKIKMFEPFNGPVYVVTDKAAIEQYIDDMNGKKLVNDGGSYYVDKSLHVCFYNKNEEIVFEFRTLGKGHMILKWLGRYYDYVGDIHLDETAFSEYRVNFGYEN